MTIIIFVVIKGQEVWGKVKLDFEEPQDVYKRQGFRSSQQFFLRSVLPLDNLLQPPSRTSFKKSSSTSCSHLYRDFPFIPLSVGFPPSSLATL